MRGRMLNGAASLPDAPRHLAQFIHDPLDRISDRLLSHDASSELSWFERSLASRRPHHRWAASTGFSRVRCAPKSDNGRGQAATSLESRVYAADSPASAPKYPA